MNKIRQRFEGLYEPEPMSGCWLWRGVVTRKGYGMFWWHRRVMLPAHRAAYRLYVAPVPETLTIDHLCRVRSCVNPRHLEPVSNRENILRGNTGAGINQRKTACIHGHPFSSENTYVRPRRGGRDCRVCLTRRRHLWLQRQQERLGI